MSIPNNIEDKIAIDRLYDLKITKFPIEHPDDLEHIILRAAHRLSDENASVILEALLNALVDFYVFDLEPGDDIDDIGFLVSDIEDRVCNAVAFRRHLLENDSDDPEDDEQSDEQDIDDDVSPEIPVICQHRCEGCGSCIRDPDDIADKDIPGMMKRFESDGFEVTVTLVPKREFD